jgi:sec-independent protein translocase protein TatB
MFDIGWSELLVIGSLALIVVGPKDLPGMLRNLGRYMGKARSMAREFQRSMEDAAREADLGELSDVQKSMRDFNKKIGLDEPSKYAHKMKKPEAKTAPAKDGAQDGSKDGSKDGAAKAAETPAAPAKPAEAAAPAKPADVAASAPAEAPPAKTGDSQAKGA